MITCAVVTIGIHLATYHFDRTRGYEDINPGVSVACDDVVGGVYRNSEGGTSVYAAKAFRNVVGPVDLAVGLVSGYRRADLMPMLLPSVKVGSTRFTLLLPVEKGGGGLHVSLEF